MWVIRARSTASAGTPFATVRARHEAGQLAHEVPFPRTSRDVRSCSVFGDLVGTRLPEPQGHRMRLIRMNWKVTRAALVLTALAAGCTDPGVERAEGPETTVAVASELSSTTSLQLAAQGCPGASEAALYDFFLDAEADVVGFATPEQALDDFRRHDDGFRLRSDWQDLSLDRVALRGDSAVGQYSNTLRSSARA